MKRVVYELLSVEYGDGCHFVSIFNIDGKYYDYDGMTQSGKLREVTTYRGKDHVSGKKGGKGVNAAIYRRL